MTGVLLRACRAAASVAAPRMRASPALFTSSVRFFSDDNGSKPTNNTERWVIGNKVDSAASATGAHDDDMDIMNLVREEKTAVEVEEPEVIVAGIADATETFVVPALEDDLEDIERDDFGMNEDDLNDDDDDDDDENDDDETGYSTKDLKSRVYESWDLQDGDLILPEMMNWMLPTAKRQPFRAPTQKLWAEFVKADLDPVELALNTDLLRLFLSPTGRMLPRRFTGLRAKQQRQLATAIKNARQMALLPYTSRYPLPSPEQMEIMTQQAIAQFDDFDFDAHDNDNDVEDEVDAVYED
ncbi:Aste57867_20445 [Aphanomyces stellatus]|uniref:Aste57867_20445 protein n=1 Tax=Aphanomyces stellatus TaxID=120398 RepID=A0A485LGH8_9STRA|nr:hypothetical protein As57867_020379 [Aphanomyces stellatus]VFT97131.1 Aste57867_20445 [Aphanomyces stellatus]